MIGTAVALSLLASGWVAGEETLEFALGEGASDRVEVLTLMIDGEGPTPIITCDTEGNIGAMLLLSETDPERSLDQRFSRRRMASGAILADGQTVYRGEYPGLDRDLYHVKSRKAAAEIYNAAIRGEALSFKQDGRRKPHSLNVPPVDDAFRSFASKCSARRD